MFDHSELEIGPSTLSLGRLDWWGNTRWTWAALKAAVHFQSRCSSAHSRLIGRNSKSSLVSFLTFGPSLLFLPTLSSRWVKSQNWT